MDVTVAAFDVDNTLTVRDCVLPFMRKVSGPFSLIRIPLKQPGTVLSLLMRRDRDGLKALFVSAVFADKSVDEVRVLGVQFASKIGENLMREDVMSRLRWHQSEGHVVILVSASLAPYLEPLGDLLEVDAVLCTELEEANGFFTGSLIGKNCRGPEKVARMTSWCTSAGIEISSVRYAYGDSNGDREMLGMVQHPLLVKDVDVEAVPA